MRRIPYLGSCSLLVPELGACVCVCVCMFVCVCVYTMLCWCGMCVCAQNLFECVLMAVCECMFEFVCVFVCVTLHLYTSVPECFFSVSLCLFRWLQWPC